MKTIYQNPTLEMVFYSDEDIISTSSLSNMGSVNADEIDGISWEQLISWEQ